MPLWHTSPFKQLLMLHSHPSSPGIHTDPPGSSVEQALAIGAVASIVVGWGVAQWEYILPETLTVDAAAAPDGTIAAVIVATVFAILLIFPAFGLLYRLDQKGLLPEEGVD